MVLFVDINEKQYAQLRTQHTVLDPSSIPPRSLLDRGGIERTSSIIQALLDDYSPLIHPSFISFTPSLCIESLFRVLGDESSLCPWMSLRWCYIYECSRSVCDPSSDRYLQCQFTRRRQAECKLVACIEKVPNPHICLNFDPRFSRHLDKKTKVQHN